MLSVIDPNMKINNVLYEYKDDIDLEKIKKGMKKKFKSNILDFPHPKDIVIISVTFHSYLTNFSQWIMYPKSSNQIFTILTLIMETQKTIV